MARIQDASQYHDYKLAQAHANNNGGDANLYNRAMAMAMANGHGHHLKSQPSTVIDIERNYATPSKGQGRGLGRNRGRSLSLVDETPAVADWNWSFCMVSLPFILLGFPIHLMLGSGASNSIGNGESDQKEADVSTTNAWLSSVVIPFNFLRIIASVVLFTVGCGLVAYFGYTVYNLVYNLAFLGEINPVVFTSLEQLIRILPVVIPLIYFWLRGHHVKNVLDSFNTIFASFAKAFHNTWKNQSHKSHGAGPEPSTSLPPTSFWCRLLRFYMAILILHGLELYLTVMTTDAFSGGDFNYHFLHSQVWIGFAFEIMNSLVLPVYCMFCWVLHSELELLVGYLNLLVYYESQPNFTIFNEIKFLYKKIARQIMAVNQVFSKYMSWLFFIVWGFASLKGGQAAIMFVKYMIISPVAPALPAFLGGDVINQMIAVGAEGEVMDENEKRVKSAMAAVIMRETLSMGLIALIQVALLGYTAFQAIRVNKAARSLHVILNDFVTYHTSNEMTTELYQAFRLLKAFIHSTMERTEEPALLRLPILNYAPYFGYRLHSYELRF